MGIAEGKRHRPALDFGPIADPHDVQVFFETLSHAPDRIRDQAPRQPMQSRLIVPFPLEQQMAILLLDPDSRGKRNPQGSLGSLYRHHRSFRLYCNPGGYFNRLTTNPRHSFNSRHSVRSRTPDSFF